MAQKFRADIQALRALAVFVVIIFHLWPNRLPGGFVGVDVFFVISGFLITSHIINDIQRGSFTVGQFWARRVRRLLPASFLVIAASTFAVMILSPNAEQLSLLWESIAATFYFENWALAANSVDYLGQGNAASPVQHFWSLSVEEQFYFVWPLLLIAASLAWLKSGKKFELRWFALPVLGILVTLSLWHSISLTESDPKVAYFSTFVRAWEFGAGALLASLPGRAVFVAPKVVRIVIVCLGFTLIIFSALTFDKSLPFPGAWAAVPVLGTCLVMWGNIHHGALHRLLALKPIQLLGDISYSAYLWHWPMIILLPLLLKSELGNLDKSLILIGTLAVALLSRKYVEKPFITPHRAKRKLVKQTLLATLVASILVAGSASAGLAAAQFRVNLGLAELAKAPVSEKCFGASARQPDGSQCENTTVVEPITPKPDLASEDRPTVDYPQCLTTNREDDELKVCSIGTKNGYYRILLIGDSHAAQFRATLGQLAIQKNWQLDSLSKGGCALSYAARVHEELLTKTCKTWVDKALKLVKAKRYDLIVTSSVSGVEWSADASSDTDPIAGFAKLYRDVNALGTKVLVVKDNPRPVKNLPTCIKNNEKTWPKVCAKDAKTAFADDPLPAAVDAVAIPNTALLNLDDVYCGPAICEPVIGKVLVYRDDNHITNTFAKTLQAKFFEAIQALRVSS